MKKPPRSPVGLPAPIDRVLSAVESVQRSGDQWKGLCPGHDDHDPSLSIRVGDDGRVLLKCHAGCPTERVVTAMDLTMADLFPDRASHRRAQRESRKKGVGNRAEITETVKPSESLTLAGYAEAKRLPMEFLQGLGLQDVRRLHRRVVKMPYLDEAGDELAVRFRVSLTGSQRFVWRKGSTLYPYGLWRLGDARRAGRVLLVEGESDAQTAWLYDIPALGIPGAATWKPAWEKYFEAIPVIYVLLEPDAGGEKVLDWLGKSTLRDRVKLVRLPDAKDLSELHIAHPDTAKLLEVAMAEAVPWAEAETEQVAARRLAALEQCRTLVHRVRILDRFAAALHAQGVTGEERAAKLLYLVVTSRLFDKPVSAAVKGPSSAGKSFVVQQVLDFFPPAAYYALTAMSDRALAYSDESLVHRMFVMYEAAGIQSRMANYLVRSLLSEGRLRYETVEKTPEGLRSRFIEREGPTGLLVTTTAAKLHEENETRLFSIPISDSPEQTRAILRELAREGSRTPLDMTEWHGLQEVLATGQTVVSVPYADILAGLVSDGAIRLRRDFRSLLALVRAHALVHQFSRGRDAEGRILATLEDYEVVYELVHDVLAEGVELTVSDTIRATVAAVRDLLAPPADEDATATVTQVARRLGVQKPTALRRVGLAIEEGYLRNLEERKGRPARLRLYQPLPEGVALLPTPERVTDAWGAPALDDLKWLEERYLVQLRERKKTSGARTPRRR